MWYQKKPLVVQAIRFDGGWTKELEQFLGHNFLGEHEDGLHVLTLHGRSVAKPGDYLIRGIKNEVYPCKPDVFEKTYEPIDMVKKGSINQIERMK